MRLDGRVLLVTGGEDDLFPQDLTPVLVDRMCGLGTELELLHYPDATHTQLSSLSRPDVLLWLDRDGTFADGCSAG